MIVPKLGALTRRSLLKAVFAGGLVLASRLRAKAHENDPAPADRALSVFEEDVFEMSVFD